MSTSPRPDDGAPIAERRWLFIVGSLGVGGAEQFLVALSAHLLERGQQVTVLSLRGGPLQERFEERGIPVISLAGSSFREFPRSIRSVLPLEGNRAPDVIVGWMYYGCIAATALKSFCRNARLLWSVHHSLDRWDQESTKTKTAVRLLRRLQAFPEKIHYCSNRSAQSHFARGFSKEKAALIYNGFDVGRFTPPSPPNVSGERRLKVVGHIARLHPMKDHGNFIAAVSRLSKERSDFRALMVGKGVDPENGKIRALMEQHAPAVPVALMGPMTGVGAILSELDVLVVSSAWGESFPIVVGEAMSCGVPCVATDVGDIQTLVGDTGIVVPPRDSQALANAIAELLDEEEPRSSERKRRCRERILDHFTLDKVADSFLALANASGRLRSG